MSKIEQMIADARAMEPGQFTVTDIVAKFDDFMREFARVDDNNWRDLPDDAADEVCGKAVRTIGTFFDLLADTLSKNMDEVLLKFVTVTAEMKRTGSVDDDEENALQSALDDFRRLKAASHA